MATATGSVDVDTASSTNNPDRNDDRRNRVVLGNLPDDFLRPDTLPGSDSSSEQEIADRELAMQLQQHQWAAQHHPAQNCVGQLIISVVEASFVKNYGMVRMDPYARVRVAHAVFETHANSSGGKTPRWNKKIQCLLPAGVKSIGIEVYDECALTVDELIAYGQVTIPEAVFRMEAVEDWYPLSGKQGENKEGSIHLIFTLMPVGAHMGMGMAPPYTGYPISGSSVVPVGTVAPMMMAPAYGLPTYSHVPAYGNPVQVTTAPAPGRAAVARPKPLTEEEVKEIESMFPSLDKQVVQSVIDACGGRREAVIDSLLQISDQ